jgi:hypothetical protein
MDWLWHPLAWLALDLALTLGVWVFAWRRAAGAEPEDRHAARLLAAAAPSGVARRAALALLPLAALALRLVTPAEMGLVPPRGPAGLIGSALLALLLAAFVDGVRSHLAPPRSRRGRQRARQPADVGQLALDALCLELNWAFLRALGLELGPATVTLAVALSLVVAGLQLLADPWRRGALARPGGVADFAQDAGLAVLSAMTFLATGSSVVALAWHLGVLWLLGTPSTEPAAPRTGADRYGSRLGG